MSPKTSTEPELVDAGESEPQPAAEDVENEDMDKEEGDPLLFKILPRDAHDEFDACIAKMRRKAAMKKQKLKKLEQQMEVEEEKDEGNTVAAKGVENDSIKEMDRNADGSQEIPIADASEGASVDSQGDVSVGEEDGEDMHSAPFNLIASYLEETDTPFPRHTLDVRVAAKVDYYCSVLTFTREACKMSIEQSSVVLSLCAQLLDTIISFGNSLQDTDRTDKTQTSAMTNESVVGTENPLPLSGSLSPSSSSSSSRELLTLVKDVMLPRMGQNDKMVNFTSDHVKKVTDFVVAG